MTPLNDKQVLTSHNVSGVYRISCRPFMVTVEPVMKGVCSDVPTITHIVHHCPMRRLEAILLCSHTAYTAASDWVVSYATRRVCHENVVLRPLTPLVKGLDMSTRWCKGAVLAGCPSCHHQWLIWPPA